MNDQSQREWAIFDAALQLPPEQRAGYLKEACGNDAALGERVRTLLNADEQGDGPLDTPLLPNLKETIVLAEPAHEKPGDRISHYKILQQIGEGGCGVVYMAEQEKPVWRHVALKVIKQGMDTKNVIARFEAERQALALMEHPNIARVFDAGATESGRPFFVMELVRGKKITEYCDENRLTTEERLELFTQVCKAIQHAHQKGIIHRDIKPSNVLVTLHDVVPVPKVIDFGIAKATDRRLTDKTLFTAFEQVIGTPAYMSPEQAEMSGLDIDTRSDIYSLGVLLYELLTGRTPFDPQKLMACGVDAMRRLIREQEPPKPSTCLSTMLDADLTTVARQRHAPTQKLIDLVRGDLDWIVMKSLEKDRTRRYESASSFAGDIEHYLNHEPVSARPPSSLYRLQKLVRRHKTLFAAGAAVAVAIVAGLVVSTYLFFREQVARRDADREAQRSQQVALFLEEMLKGVGPGVALGRDTTLLREILDKTVARVAKDLKDQPEVQAEICNTLGDVYRALGQSGRAEQLHRDARSLLELSRSPKGRRDLSLSLNDLAVVLRDQGRLAEAEALQRQALELRRQLYRNEDAKVAESLNNLALVLRSEGRLADAEKMSRDALDMQRKLFGRNHLAVATSLNNIGMAMDAEGRSADAEPYFRESLRIQRKLAPGDQPGKAVTLHNLADLLRKEGKLDAAERLERRSLEIFQKILGPDHPHVATGLNELGLILAARGKNSDAEEQMTKALALRKKLLGPEHPDVASSLHDLAGVLREEKRTAQAEVLARDALAMRKKLFGDEHIYVAASQARLAQVLDDEGNLAEAETLLRQAIEIDRKVLGDRHPAVAASVRHLASVLKRAHKDAELEELARQDWVVSRGLMTQNSPQKAP
jgi:serine/threonine protein kinase/tetratricopeptide (TPR) repeat protein